MKGRARIAVAMVAAFAMASVAAGCGSSSSSSSKNGGSITIGTVGPDSYDPVEFQTLQAVSALHLVYTPLLAYSDTTGPSSQNLIPGLAESVPTPTNGGKTYTFKLRPGLHYSDGEPVKASDAENSIKRMLNLAGPFASFYSGIVGADAYVKAGKPTAPLPGVTADDSTGVITFNLTKPDTRFLFAMALPSVAPTPASKSPFKNLTSNPPPGDGPYTMQIVNPSQEFILTKNPKFDVPSVAKGHVDKITAQISSNVNQMTENIINGSSDYMTEDPVGDLLPQVEQKYSDRFKLSLSIPNTYYFFLNTTIPPFNNLAARQAVNYALDPTALQRIFGGRLKPTCNFLPPGMVGYQTLSPCPWRPNGKPDLAKAQALVKQAGLTGQPVTVWTNTKDPRPAIADYLRSVLDQLGFKTTTKSLNQQVYFSTIGNPKTKAQIGFTDWFQDFPHPGDFFGNLLTGAALASSPTFNEGLVNDPQVNAAVDAANAKTPQAAESEWAALDKLVTGTSKAYVAVYGNEEQSTFMSSRMNFQNCSGAPHFVYRNDWSLFCLK